MSTKQVQVHADGLKPDTLELTKYEDRVIFIQADPKAPLTVHLDSQDLFGTGICSVGKSAAEATVYTPKAVGNYVIGLAPSKQSDPGTVQVLCLASTHALGTTSTGSIRVTG